MTGEEYNELRRSLFAPTLAERIDRSARTTRY